MQDCSISSALAMEILQSCIKPPMLYPIKYVHGLPCFALLWLNYISHHCRFNWSIYSYPSGCIFIKRTNVFPQDLVKSLSCEIRFWTFPIAQKFDGHLGNSAASDTIITTSNLVGSRLHGIWQYDVTAQWMEAQVFFHCIRTIIPVLMNPERHG